jgi:hypothetical protein
MVLIKKEGLIFLVGNDSMRKDARKIEVFDAFHNNWQHTRRSHESMKKKHLNTKLRRMETLAVHNLRENESVPQFSNCIMMRQVRVMQRRVYGCA